MAQKLYALLVGINDYSPAVGKLQGCVNDVENFRAHLAANYDNAAIEVLKDADATRANVIAMFRSHLSKATADDVTLFQFCGHGARWAAAKEFAPFYPDGYDEGLVCYDSRTKDGSFPFDLADKELAILIAEIAAKNPHIAVILDCCHSGSGTRDADAFNPKLVRARQTHEVRLERPLESYLDGYYTARRASGEPLHIPASKHVLLAACERVQKAWETTDHSGVFTDTLLEVLQKSGNAISYADLFVRCRAAVRKRTDNQNPQFETYKNFNALSGFLGRAGAPARRRYSVSFEDNTWKLGAGAISGLPTEPEKNVGLVLYDVSNPTHTVGNASTTSVGPHESVVQLDFPGDTSVRYAAEITSLPVPPMPVFFSGEQRIKAALESALASNGMVNAVITDEQEGARYALTQQDGELWLVDCDSELRIQGVELNQQDHGKAAELIMTLLSHVTRWERSLALQNQRTQMDTSLVDFVVSEVLPDGSEYEYPGTELTLDFAQVNGEWKPVVSRIRVRNRTQQALHIIFAHFTSAYGIKVYSNEPIPPGERFVTLEVNGNPDPQFYLDDPLNHAVENLKLIVSTERVDDFLLTQEDLAVGKILPSTRGFGTPPTVKKYKNDWFTKNIRVKVVRRLDRIGAADTSLAQGKIIVKGHPSMTGMLSLAPPTAPPRAAAVIPTRAAAVIPTRAAAVIPTRAAAVIPTRGIDEGTDFYRAFERQGLSLLSFGQTRGDNDTVLELTDMQNTGVLKDTPLELELRVPLNEQEGILPFVFDGQHVLLGGDSYKDDLGHTHISIDHVPELPDNRRSLGSALKLYFFKTYLKRANVNKLRWVADASGDTVQYREDDIAAKVAAAKNIILLMHGIIGDTDVMAKGLWQTSLHSRFDLVLTYDYENLGTSIGDIARTLKNDLATYGIGAEDGKRLTLLVHSMGGLVARWFIEREGGNGVVDHLVMCGTPNSGSPYGLVDSARKAVSALTSLAATYMPWMIPFSGPLLFLLNRTKKVTGTLEQMNPSSEFIRTLNVSDDPRVQYTVLAGNIQHYNEPSDSFFPKFLEKVGKGFLLDSLFGTAAHDIAVSDESILAVGEGRSPSPRRANVACHHLNYFVSDAGKQALRDVAW